MVFAVQNGINEHYHRNHPIGNTLRTTFDLKQIISTF